MTGRNHPSDFGLGFVAEIREFIVVAILAVRIFFAIEFIGLQHRSLLVGQLDVTETADHFQNFAAGWEHATGVSLVFVQSVHEFDLFVAVVPFTSGGVDLAATLLLALSWLCCCLGHHLVCIRATVITTTIDSCYLAFNGCR